MFLIRPRPFSNESLSSWRQRSGMVNGFRRFPRQYGQYGIPEPDRFRSTAELAWLASEFNVAEKELVSLTLDYNARFTASIPFKTHKQRWILPLGQRAHPPRSGPVYCADCLKEDREPYFRVAWRFAFLGHCPVHGSALLDRCPSCETVLWPASITHINSSKWHNLRHCQQCGHDLSAVVQSKDTLRDSQIFNALWECFMVGRTPSDTWQSFRSEDYFNGLWSMSQLVLRRQSSHIQQYLPPLNSSSEYVIAHETTTVELLPVAKRRGVVSAAAWLLQDWPMRFLDIAEKAKITRVHLMANRDAHPEWMTDLIDKHLSLRRRGTVTVSQVQHTMRALRSRSIAVSKVAVRRALEVSESAVIDDILFQREHATLAELETMINRFEAALRTTSHARAQNAALVRDYTMFLMSVLLKRSVEHVCPMTKQALDYELSLVEADMQPNDAGHAIGHRVCELNDIYSAEIRPSFLKNTESSPWFVSRFGIPIEAHSVRNRVSKIMRAGFPSNLWRSADVFIYVLGTARVGRRASARMGKLALNKFKS